MSEAKFRLKPDYATPPGETLAETLEARGMTQADFAERTGRPKKTINEIIQGKAAITAQTAIQFERVLGVPASFWNNLERNYREVLARREEQEHLCKRVDWLKQYPVSKMIRLGWIPAVKSQVDKVAALLNFFALASPEQDDFIKGQMATAFRKASAFKSDQAAVAAWLRRGEIQAQEIICQPYEPALFENHVQKIRELTTKQPNIFGPEMRRLCAAAGVAVVFTPELPGSTCLCGASRWVSPNRAILQLSLRYKTDDQLWFTFFHECCHLLKHSKKAIYLDEKSSGGVDALEKEANQYAGDLLIPPQRYRHFITVGNFDIKAVEQFAQSIRIAPGIVVGRLQHDKHLAWNFPAHNALKLSLRYE